MIRNGSEDSSADVIVVGAGPAGSAAAYHLAKAGLDVLVLEKATFPRDKICGDGLTPAAVRELLTLGIDPLKEIKAGSTDWATNKGLCVIGGGHKIYLPWPDQPSLPNYGLTRARKSLDHYLAEHAVKAGARLRQGVNVEAPIESPSGYLRGVTARVTAPSGRRQDATTVQFRSKLVIDAGGGSARLATACGLEKRQNRPLGVAVRAYYRSERSTEEWMESHLELWDGPAGQSNLLPGYGWMFPMSDGTVNLGLGSVSSKASATKLPYKQIFQQWVSNLPPEWGFTETNQTAPLRSAALPMCFNRTPHYRRGLLLVGDSGGMISPFNGEGISPALTAGRLAAQAIIQAFGRTTPQGREQALSLYPQALRAEYGGYYNLGRVFVSLIEHPQIMRLCTTYGLNKPRLMRLVHKLLSDGYEPRGGDSADRLIQLLTKVVPSA